MNKMTLKQIAESDEFKTDLAAVLDNPNLKIALQALIDDNLPSLEVRAVPGMDPLHAIALDAAKRAGAQAVITRLQRLPYATNGLIERARNLGQPWEYLQPESPDTETKPRKRTRK